MASGFSSSSAVIASSSAVIAFSSITSADELTPGIYMVQPDIASYEDRYNTLNKGGKQPTVLNQLTFKLSLQGLIVHFLLFTMDWSIAVNFSSGLLLRSNGMRISHLVRVDRQVSPSHACLHIRHILLFPSIPTFWFLNSTGCSIHYLLRNARGDWKRSNTDCCEFALAVKPMRRWCRIFYCCPNNALHREFSESSSKHC